MPVDPRRGARQLSVVIPSFNSAQWLPSTLHALAEAIRAADATAQLVLVDDGSTDETVSVVSALAETFPGALEIVSQANAGRFAARWAGLERARYATTLLLDSRVLLDVDAIDYHFRSLDAEPDVVVRNGHVTTDPAAPLVGRFWEVPTHLFWAGYLRRPRAMDIIPENFDAVPKGTGIFLAPTALLQEAFVANWPDDEERLVSDDTKLLRWLVRRHRIRLDPKFSALYRPRTSVRGFIAHTFDRGTLFVDSYAGTTAVRSIILLALAALPIAFVACIAFLIEQGFGGVAVAAVVVALAAALAPVVPAAFNHCAARGILAYALFLPIFVVPFWSGLVRGIFIHRRAFLRGRSARSTTSEESNPT